MLHIRTCSGMQAPRAATNKSALKMLQDMQAVCVAMGDLLESVWSPAVQRWCFELIVLERGVTRR